MTHRPTRIRAGFTLIELLVVISIIAVLAAITSGVLGRVRAAQAKTNTDSTLSKINSLIERRWKAVLEQINDDIKSNHPTYTAVLGHAAVNGNQDLAKAVYTYAKLKNELPMSVDEARFDVQVLPAAGSSLAVIMPAKAVYKNAFPTPPFPAGAFSAGTPEESAVCLYLAVTTNAGGGTAIDQDGLQQQTGDFALNGRSYKVFKDAWGMPIAFARAAYNSEVNGSPLVPTGQTAFDPLDPAKNLNGSRGKLGILGSNLTALGSNLSAWWNSAKPPITWAPIPANYTASANHTWTAISAGPNKQWGTDPYGLPPIVDTDPSKDNQLSYRLRREGARGE